MNDSEENEQGEWWESLYDDLLANVLLENGDPQEIDRTIGLLEEVLDLSEGQVKALDESGQVQLLVPEWRCVYRVSRR